jgi:hypothetical protein
MKDDIITKSPLLGLSHSGSSNLCSSVPDAARRERYASFDSPKCFQLLNSFMFSKRFMFGTSSSSSICFNERNDEHVPIKYKNIVFVTL